MTGFDRARLIVVVTAAAMLVLGFVIPLHHLGPGGSATFCLLGLCAFVLTYLLFTVPMVGIPHVGQRGHYPGMLIPVALYRPPRP